VNHRADAGDGYLVLYWFLGWLCTSVVYRLLRRKPILFFSVAGSQYLEQGVSGGAARNCLVVAIAEGRLIIRPFFPFNLLFLPEIYRLEIDVPVENVVSAELLSGPRRSAWRNLFSVGRNVHVSVRQPGHRTETIQLQLASPEAFIKLLPRRAQG
jgi:hypothetical protein